MKKLLVIAILLSAQNINADALSDAIRRSDVAAVKELFYASCHSPEKMRNYKELAQETIHLRREGVVVQDLRPRADSNNPASNRYFNASMGAICVSLLSPAAWPLITEFLYGKCPYVDYSDKFQETRLIRDAYWEKDSKVFRSCLGICFLSFCAAARCLKKSIEVASIAIYNRYDDAVTVKEILNYCDER